MDNKRYQTLSSYLKNKFGEKTLKICVDGGFSCPNRDGKVGYGGCIFCGERGAGEHLKKEINIESQIIEYLKSYRAERANKFIVYLQNFSNTYDNIENLKRKYDSCFIDERIVGFAIATRPDCINEEVVKLIKSYSDKYYVWVELGLQTASDKTADFINRGYKKEVFSKAVNILNQYNIDIVTHIMIGLPNENHLDLEETVNFINKHNIQGLKIHSTYITQNTKLEELYKKENYFPISLDEYIKEAAYVLTHINPKIIIHKVSGDAPKELLIAPEWNRHKKWILNGLDKYMKENDLYQGKYYTP